MIRHKIFIWHVFTRRVVGLEIGQERLWISTGKVKSSLSFNLTICSLASAYTIRLVESKVDHVADKMVQREPDVDDRLLERIFRLLFRWILTVILNIFNYNFYIYIILSILLVYYSLEVNWPYHYCDAFIQKIDNHYLNQILFHLITLFSHSLLSPFPITSPLLPHLLSSFHSVKVTGSPSMSLNLHPAISATLPGAVASIERPGRRCHG